LDILSENKNNEKKILQVINKDIENKPKKEFLMNKITISNENNESSEYVLENDENINLESSSDIIGNSKPKGIGYFI
jgi:hypothetical protein